MNTKLKRIKETLESVLGQFQAERITTDKGILDVQKAGNDIAIGDTVVLVDEEGTESKAEDGDYILTDGTVLKIAGGKIDNIVEPEKEEAPAEEDNTNEEFSKICAEKFESYEEREMKIYEAIRDQKGVEGWLMEAGEDYAVISIWNGDSEKAYRYPYAVAEDGSIVVGDGEEVEEKREYVPVNEEEPAVVEEVTVEEAPVEEEAPAEENFEEVENPTNEGEESDTDAVVKLREEVNELYKIVDELKARLDEIEKKPAAEPATEEFKKVNRITKTGNEKLDRLAKIMSA